MILRVLLIVYKVVKNWEENQVHFDKYRESGYNETYSILGY